MNGGAQQNARVMAAVAADVAHWMARPCHPAPADGLTPLQRIAGDAELQRRAAVEWDAIPNGTADIKAWMRDIETKESRHG